jgi:hypothetical protein
VCVLCHQLWWVTRWKLSRWYWKDNCDSISTRSIAGGLLKIMKCWYRKGVHVKSEKKLNSTLGQEYETRGGSAVRTNFVLAGRGSNLLTTLVQCKRHVTRKVNANGELLMHFIIHNEHRSRLTRTDEWCAKSEMMKEYIALICTFGYTRNKHSTLLNGLNVSDRNILIRASIYYLDSRLNQSKIMRQRPTWTTQLSKFNMKHSNRL